MVGFRNVAEYANADENGKVFVTQFRKAVSSTATITSSYIDYTYFAGSPLANFYASTPLASAYVDSDRGIYRPSGDSYLKNIMCMSSASGAAVTTSRAQKLMLADYLMYYPFVDTDAVGEQQDMTQSVSIPRYGSGQVFAVAQAASSTIGQFTMTYTNQDGVGGRVSPNAFTQIVAGGGQSLMANISGGGFNPFVPLQAGDSGVKSIESVTFTAGGGGLMALVIIKPIQTFFLFQECRTNSAAFGSAVAVESVINKAGAPKLKDGAVLGIISKGNGGSLASSTLIGIMETVKD